jgi:D-arabinose 1-dehydrogenase-like Zn-dependent alcohol dehydrogenase
VPFNTHEFLVQVATVVAMDRSNEKLELAKEVGADFTLNIGAIKNKLK